MAKAKKKKITFADGTIVASNRQARRDYDILDTLEVGMVLRGSEAKSLRESKVTLTEAWAQVYRGELWLHGLHISPYSHAAAVYGHEPDRQRKLLAHRGEILRLEARLDRERLSLIPLALYFKNGRAKLELAVARGRKQFDRRQAIAKKDAARDAERDLARARRF